jgi:hypothetical protein
MAEPLRVKDSTAAHQFPVCSTGRIATGGVVFVLCLILGIVSIAIAVDDSYIAGYAAAVLRHEFDAAKASLHVREGVVIVDAQSLGTVDQKKSLPHWKAFPVWCEWKSGRARLTPMSVNWFPFSKSLPNLTQNSFLMVSS